jgi:hypothetical protein
VGFKAGTGYLTGKGPGPLGQTFHGIADTRELPQVQGTDEVSEPLDAR